MTSYAKPLTRNCVSGATIEAAPDTSYYGSASIFDRFGRETGTKIYLVEQESEVAIDQDDFFAVVYYDAAGKVRAVQMPLTSGEATGIAAIYGSGGVGDGTEAEIRKVDWGLRKRSC